ncbi:MAG: hypothetical protein IKP50_00390 [Bacilli bacterium]|nr:hypothetical protein [Bacilli bacterium]
MILEEIMKIIQDCEDIQESHESAYTKEQAKIHAYEEIKELTIVRKEEK